MALDGWLNRYLQTSPAQTPLRAASFGDSVTHALQGQESVSVFNQLANFKLGVPGAEEPVLEEYLSRIYDQRANAGKPYRSLTHDSGKVMLRDLEIISRIDTRNYSPANGAEYPNTSFLWTAATILYRNRSS